MMKNPKPSELMVLRPLIPKPIPVHQVAPPALTTATAASTAHCAVWAQAPVPSEADETAASPPAPSVASIRALPATSVVAEWERPHLDFKLNEEALLADAQRVQPVILKNHPMRSKFDLIGARVLERTDGNWGWRIGPKNHPVRFQVVAKKNAWLALRHPSK
jgi:hypothetical protein